MCYNFIIWNLEAIGKWYTDVLPGERQSTWSLCCCNKRKTQKHGCSHYCGSCGHWNIKIRFLLVRTRVQLLCRGSDFWTRNLLGPHSNREDLKIEIKCRARVTWTNQELLEKLKGFILMNYSNGIEACLKDDSAEILKSLKIDYVSETDSELEIMAIDSDC